MNDHAIIQRDVLSTSLNNKFDVIFGSDIVACPYVDALNSLIETLEYYFNENPKLLIYISYKRRNESENNYFWNIIHSIRLRHKLCDRSSLHVGSWRILHEKT